MFTKFIGVQFLNETQHFKCGDVMQLGELCKYITNYQLLTVAQAALKKLSSATQLKTVGTLDQQMLITANSATKGAPTS